MTRESHDGDCVCHACADVQIGDFTRDTFAAKLDTVKAERERVQRLIVEREQQGFDKHTLRQRVKRQQLHEALLSRRIELLVPQTDGEQALREQLSELKAQLSERRVRMRHSSDKWRRAYAEQVVAFEAQIFEVQQRLDELTNRSLTIQQWPRPKTSGHDHPWHHEPSQRELRQMRRHQRRARRRSSLGDLRLAIGDLLDRMTHLHRYRQLRAYETAARRGELVEVSEQRCACGAERRVVRRLAWHGRVPVEIRRVMSGTWDIEGRVIEPAPQLTSLLQPPLKTKTLRRLLHEER